MTTNIQNYGITKTLITNNNKKYNSTLKWKGNYDGNKANIHLNLDENGITKHVSMQLNNDDLMDILGLQPVAVPLEQRLSVDFLNPLTLDRSLIKNKTYSLKHNKRGLRLKQLKTHRHINHKKRNTRKV